LEKKNAPYKFVNKSGDVEVRIYSKDKDGAEE